MMGSTPNTSKPNPGHETILGHRLTYIPMARGFLYLVAIMDWHSRYVLAWGATRNDLWIFIVCEDWKMGT